MTAERYSFPPRIGSQKLNGVNVQKRHTIGIARVASGNVGAVRIRTLLHIVTGDVCDHEH